MTYTDEIRGFDPNQPGDTGTLWGLPFSVDEAALVIVPVPWEVTVSFGAGTASAPSAVVEASIQVDLFNESFPQTWKRGIAMASASTELERLNAEMRPKALELIQALSSNSSSPVPNSLAEVNAACETMVARVRSDAAALLDQGKLVGVLGGDHSVPLGLLQALAERLDEPDGFGILHVDAHCDLRNAYEGFVHSHASIMRNALELSGLSKLVQVGVRDYCDEEIDVVAQSGGTIELVTDQALSRRRFRGETWSVVVDDILGGLPENVYVSFDIDGLDPSLCPGTGTPVPGGLGFEEAVYLIEQLAFTRRKIIGFDLSEVSSSGERGSAWDANVGARLLYKLSCSALSTQ